MKKNNLLDKARNWFLKFVQVQLLLSLISLPILTNWGFPISLLSPVGNIAFTPIFMAFLLLSTMIFFSELLHIPNNFLIYLLEKTTTKWLYLLPTGKSIFIVGFTKPPIIFSIIVPIATFAIIRNKKINSIKKRILCLALLFIFSCTYLKIINKPAKFIKNIECCGGNLTLIYDKGKTVLIDPGFIGRKISADSWVEYTLSTEITKSCGSTSIDHLILLQPGKSLFEAAKKICETFQVKNIYLPYWQGDMKKNVLRSYYKMKLAAESSNACLKRLRDKKIETIFLTDSTNITIKPLDQKLVYNKAKFAAICITCDFDKQEIKIYSAKSKLGKIKSLKGSL